MFTDKSQRKVFGAIVGGKTLGIAGVLAGIRFLPGLLGGTPAGALAKDIDFTEANTATLVNATNTMWVLVAAFLVFFMQAGFMMLEAGFARTREAVNVLLECIVDTGLCGILFFAFGFAFMFGKGNGFIGHSYFFLHGAPATYDYAGTADTGVAFLAFFLFQFAFADTCSTITSGAMVGRTSFFGDLLYSVGVSGFVYPIIGHWTWGPGGWLATMSTPFRDFAGSTMVHTVGAMMALSGALALGPRLGRVFKRDGGGPMAPHDLTVAAIGGVILWFGWYGFNPGSTLSAIDAAGIGRVATNTTLAACAGALVPVLVLYPKLKTWDMAASINGFLGGLVAITCPCYWVTPAGSIAIGAIASVLVIAVTELLEHLRIDDPVGAVPVHGACGIFGTLSLGLFAAGYPVASGATGPATDTLKGLLYGGGADVMKAQIIGSATITAASLVIGLVLMFGLKYAGVLRVSEAGELEGLDIHEHGTIAYPEIPGMVSFATSSPHATGPAVAIDHVAVAK